jgi:hypothetical protein
MPNTPNNPTRFANKNIRNRLADLQAKYGLSDALRQILHNEFEAAAKYWFGRAGGKESKFEKLFNQ